MNDQSINSNITIQGETPILNGTKVSVKKLFDFIEIGKSIDYLLYDFEGATK